MMDEAQSLSFSNKSAESCAANHKPYSFRYTFNARDPLAGFTCFLGEKAPLKVYIVGYFHAKHCPVETSSTSCQIDSDEKLPREAVTFSNLLSRSSSIYEKNWNTKRPQNTNILKSINEKVYELLVEHGQDRWILFKTHAQIFELYEAVKKHIFLKPHKLLRSSSSKVKNPLPLLPKRANSSQCGKHFKTRRKILGQFFTVVCEEPVVRNVPKLLQFLEVSHLSFIRDLGYKQKEGLVMMQKTKGYFRPFYKRRWLIVKDTCVSYLKSEHRIGGVFLMDKNFRVGTETSWFRKNSFVISNGSLRYRVRCLSEFDRIQFLFDIHSALESTAFPFVQPAPNQSFAPVRYDVQVKWFNDVLVFFEAMGKAVASARDEIFIAGWFLAPMVSLKPNATQHSEWCLDFLLKWKAYQGVRVYILLSGEFQFADCVESAFKNNANVTVMCHPLIKNAGDDSIHHERFLIIDQRTAFVGGMDSSIYFWDSRVSDSLTEDDTIKSNEFQNELSSTTDRFSYSMQPPKQRIQSLIEDISADTGATGCSLRTPVNSNATPIDPPLHDVMCCVFGSSARDIARHFIQRWNAALLGYRHLKMKPPLLLPMTYEGIDEPRAPDCYNCSTQVLRSACGWSAGLRHTEASIYEAILSCIEAAQHFIYIESHFFVNPIDGGSVVENEVGRALVEKIAAMHKEKRPFHVYVVLPLLPVTNSADISKMTPGEIMRNVLYRQQLFLTRGKNCFFDQLQNAVSSTSVREFISFCGLRAFCPKTLTTNQVQIYSKLWIFDDREVILGSANITDRSLAGDQDSEVCLHIVDTEWRRSRMNGKFFQAGKFALSLRMALMAEHLGLDVTKDERALSDPVSNSFYKTIWMETARKNTNIFEKVFNCCPSNSVRNFKQLDSCLRAQPLAVTAPTEARDLLQKIRGTLVDFPLYFLRDEELRPSDKVMKAMPRRMSTI